jgi:plastocyanin
MRKLAMAGVAGALSLALVGGSAGASGGPTVTASNFSFTPKTIHINAGQRVTWKDTQGEHTVTFKNSNYDKTIGVGDTVSRRFKKPGTFRYICTFHITQGMKGKVVVN